MRKIILALIFILAIGGSCFAGMVVGSGTAAPPQTPTGLSASDSPPQYTATWTSVSGATSYNVVYSTSSALTGTTYDGSNSYPGTPNATAGKYTVVATNSKNISGPLTALTTYYVRVSAVNANGESSYAAAAAAAAADYLAEGIATFSITDNGLGYTCETYPDDCPDKNYGGDYASCVFSVDGGTGGLLTVLTWGYDYGFLTAEITAQGTGYETGLHSLTPYSGSCGSSAYGQTWEINILTLQ